MSYTLSITVRQDHIDQGVRCDGNICPVTLAVRDAIGPGKPVFTSPSNVIIGEDAYPLPEAARMFVARFDKRLHVDPFTFEIEV